GFDAFGIHTENYAIKVGKNPHILVPETVNHFREHQFKKIGAMFDWGHEVNTTDPNYYKWTQWLFVQMYKAGLAVRKTAPVNWCPSCKTVLSDEQVIAGECERCSTEVIKREMQQWFFKITNYAQKLLDNLNIIDWAEITKKAEEVWIGRSEGAEVDFPIANSPEKIRVFTTRPDTLFGATYMVLAPEHPLVNMVTTPEQRGAVEDYIRETRRKDAVERSDLSREKTGVFTGGYAINPANNENIPIWISDYVLMTYGTGAIMAVPGHDERDFEFAKMFNLPIVEVISPDGNAHVLEQAYVDHGVLINSGAFNRLDSEEAKGKITSWLGEKGLAEKAVNYRLHDWCISRQRYWGPPIPIIYCDHCGTLPVPEKDLPVLLPETDQYLPDGSGRSPLARIESFVHTRCPECGGPAQREPDVSDTYLDSSWYFLRYPSTDFHDVPFDPEMTKKWLPVDMYIGGNEHAVLHLMYSRFVTMVLHDLGYLDFEEPFKKFRVNGLIIKDGAKMSKSRGNVVNPDDYINAHGADTFRMYLLFLGPYEEGGDFRDDGIIGVRRFLERVWSLVEEGVSGGSLNGSSILQPLHKTIKKVTDDIESLKYNTAIAALMELTNEIKRLEINNRQVIETVLKLLAPLAPYITEELWERLGHPQSIFQEKWPEYDPALVEKEEIELVVQINGKVRRRITISSGMPEETIKEIALSDDRVQELIQGKSIKKTIVVPNKLINIVV
ncbi:MAG: leucine--tRNA ligase, partial [Candidatus Tectomicrobia bacterium]|nr:leucine--tRNA ligase [Candidatus Tectomicrobia bacterium]